MLFGTHSECRGRKGGFTIRRILAEMAGLVAEVKVAAGDEIAPGSEIVILESMKMQIPVVAQQGGRVVEVSVTAGAFVNEGDVLVVLDEAGG